MKKKILLISDSPYVTSGLGRMSRYFIKMLPEFDWTVWGFLHPEFSVKHGKYRAVSHPEDFKTKVEIISPISFSDDQYGFEFLPGVIKDLKPDFIITSMDFHHSTSILQAIKELQFIQNFKWINYFPMDREDYKKLELDLFRFPDVNVCITKFGVDKIHAFNRKQDIKQIYHPIDAAEFPDVERKDIIDFKLKTWPGVQRKTFMAGTVNRSFARKDTARLVRSFVEFLKQTKNTYCYLHGSSTTFERVDLIKLAYESEMPEKRLAFLPKEVNEVEGIPQDLLNKIYRSLDLFVTVSTGEGFGFSTVEALLTETPIIAPNNTCFPELVHDFGYLLDTQGMAFHNNGTTTMWPIVKINDVVEKMIYVQNNYTEAKDKAKKGRQWVIKNLNLETIASQWREILK